MTDGRRVGDKRDTETVPAGRDEDGRMVSAVAVCDKTLHRRRRVQPLVPERNAERCETTASVDSKT